MAEYQSTAWYKDGETRWARTLEEAVGLQWDGWTLDPATANVPPEVAAWQSRLRRLGTDSDSDLHSSDVLNPGTITGKALREELAESGLGGGGGLDLAALDTALEQRQVMTATDVSANYVSAVIISGQGIDATGATSSQSAIAAKVSSANTFGAAVHWPAGNYLTTASIPYLHKVKHSGPGAIIRGSEVFRPAQRRGSTNRLYLSPTGNNANDGLSATQPMRTLPEVFNGLNNYGPVLAGTWRVILASGTYTDAGQLIGLLTLDDHLIVEGPDVAGGVPTAIIDPGAGAGYGLWFASGMQVRVRNIKVQNVTGNSVAAGIVLDKKTFGWMENVHTTNTTWAGVNANVQCQALISGGRYEAVKPGFYGVRIYSSSSATVGYNAATYGRPQFVNCVVGVVYQGSSYGHTDDCDFINCDIGLVTEFRSHSTNYNNSYTDCNVGWQSSAFSSISTAATTTLTNVNVRSRHRSGWATGDDEDVQRYAAQYYDDKGSGRFCWGYPTWHTPWAKHQFTGDTQSGMNLSSYAPASMLLETGGNTIFALAAKSPAYSALWFGDETSPQQFAIRYAASNGGADLFFAGTSAYRVRSTDFYATVDAVKELGRSAFRWLRVWAKEFRPGTAGANAPIWTSGIGSPEGVLTARVGSLYTREDGAAVTTLYVKESGTGNTGWVAK